MSAHGLLPLLRSTTARTSPAATWAPARDVDPADHAGVRRADGVLHLHRLEDQHRLAGGDRGADLDGDADDGARHRREQRTARHRVGRVDEPRLAAQRDVPLRRVDVDARPRVTVTSYVVRMPSASSVTESGAAPTTDGRDRRRRTPSRPPSQRDLDLVTGDAEPVTCGWQTTLRQRDRDAGLDGTARRPRALGERERRGGGRRAGRPAGRSLGSRTSRKSVPPRRPRTARSAAPRPAGRGWSPRRGSGPWRARRRAGAAACSRVGAQAITLASIAS